MMKIIKDKTWISMLTELFYLLVIALVCLKLSYAISAGMDILFHDESIYLDKGNNFNLNYLFMDGFIYFAWYKLLSFFVTDTITLYYFNYIVLLSINPFLIYILLRKMKQARFTSAVFSILFLISTVNVIAWPLITRFALAIILGTFILIFSVKDKRNKYLVALFGLSLLVYTRPEYILSLIIFSIVSIIYLLYRYNKSHNRVLVLVGLLTLILTIFIVFAQSPARTNRNVMAFGQHYGVHLYNKGKISEDPNTNWRKIMKKNFHTDQSIILAFLSNPGEMTNHVLANIRDIPYQAMQLFFPYNIKNKLVKKILLVMVGLLFILLMIVVYRKKKGKPFFHTDYLDENIFYWLSILIIIPLLVIVCLVYPREHYLLVLFAILLITAAKNVPAIPGNWKFKWALPLIILFVLYWVPWQVSGASGFLPGKIVSIHHNQCTNLVKIKFTRNIKVNSKIVFLGSGGSMEPYIHNFKHIDKRSKDIPFNRYIERENINMMEVNKGLTHDPRFISDEEFSVFISGIPGNGWIKIKIPRCNGYLAVKEDIL
jgi:hypothetical protein